MKSFRFIIVLFLAMSCSKDTDDVIENLASYVEGRTSELGAVIACAATDKDSNNVLTFYYPVDGATDIRLYQTNRINLNENDFSNYNRVYLQNTPVFNGHLGKYEQASEIEKWRIVTFELENDVKISNPIRSKQSTKPTLWNDAVVIEQNNQGMPNFSWEDNPVGDNAIYFQIVSNSQNDLLSGTYTYDNQFQYYNTSNVVLNVTTTEPPILTTKTQYNFTLMDVSQDNWVNWVVEKSFTAK